MTKTFPSALAAAFLAPLRRSSSPVVLLGLVALIALPAFADEQILDGRFENGRDQFWASGGVTLSRSPGRLCLDVPAGGKPWERLVGVDDLHLETNQSYRLTMRADGDVRPFPVLVQRAVEPWTEQARLMLKPGAEPTSIDFTPRDNQPSQLVLQLGGAETAYHLCLHDVSLKPAAPQSATAGKTAREPETGIGKVQLIAVNQAGYLPTGPKRATLLTTTEAPLRFLLIDGSGLRVASGITQPTGFDKTAGAMTQVIDFTDVPARGANFHLEVGGLRSEPFPIRADLYQALRVDALSWFYPQRSGIEIKADIAGEDYARAAGHVGVRPNQGDTAVGCLSGSLATTLYGGWTCDYRLDVSGGWYDAGDQGKYAVTGAIAAAQLLGAYERALATGAKAAMKDGLARLPEAGNGKPDLLDEARYELDFLLRLQVPAGKPLAGMVHHKVHDTSWTEVPMLPAEDPKPRALHRPSTAATLDLAAVAAQGARLFAATDKAYAEKLLMAARTAYSAAKAHPDLFAPTSDGQQGGGDYQDDDISDEGFWAASELFITTGDADFLADAKASEHWEGSSFVLPAAFDWRSVAGLARIDLALYGSKLPADDRQYLRSAILEAGAAYLALQQGEPFGHAYHPEDDAYNWGSNQMLLQNMLVMAAAFDLSQEPSLLKGIRESMDYLLGRNALGFSYITGYGRRAASNQHSRWYAHQLDASLPNPPPGTLAGGPNSTLVDEVAKRQLKGCAPQRCYLDEIKAWGSNEMAINWNAPLVAVASFLADRP
ncbi:glycoside hydrolase family 9 protein [Rhizobium sp. YIM 134829]|uniref:glycoside hydrolase family 9 protein n=1 Tax=Rhizobium sp. YIM 134829 TaxID=3390453 RepID=UPI00397BD221